MQRVETLQLKSEEEIRESLFEKISRGEIGLFLGAGASVSAGIPPSKKLVELIHTKFSKIEKIKDFNEICEAIYFHELYGKPILYDFLQKIFLEKEPSESHKKLPLYDWRVIYTTNYDDLLKKSYEVKKRIKPARIIRSSQDIFDPFNRDYCYVVKLNGCGTRNISERGEMALSVLDLRRARKERDNCE